MQRKTNGFTLVEVVIAIAIIGILFAVFSRLGNFGGTIGKAKDGARQIALKTLHSIVETEQIFNSAYPDGPTLMKAMTENGFQLPDDATTCFYYAYNNDDGEFYVTAKASDNTWVSSGSVGATMPGASDKADCETGPPEGSGYSIHKF